MNWEVERGSFQDPAVYPSPLGGRRAESDTSPHHRPRPIRHLITSHASPPGRLSANPINTHSDPITLLGVRNPKSHHQANAHVAWIGGVPEQGFNTDLLQEPKSSATIHVFQSPGQRECAVSVTQNPKCSLHSIWRTLSDPP